MERAGSEAQRANDPLGFRKAGWAVEALRGSSSNRPSISTRRRKLKRPLRSRSSSKSWRTQAWERMLGERRPWATCPRSLPAGLLGLASSAAVGAALGPSPGGVSGAAIGAVSRPASGGGGTTGGFSADAASALGASGRGSLTGGSRREAGSRRSACLRERCPWRHGPPGLPRAECPRRSEPELPEQQNEDQDCPAARSSERKGWVWRRRKGPDSCGFLTLVYKSAPGPAASRVQGELLCGNPWLPFSRLSGGAAGRPASDRPELARRQRLAGPQRSFGVVQGRFTFRWGEEAPALTWRLDSPAGPLRCPSAPLHERAGPCACSSGHEAPGRAAERCAPHRRRPHGRRGLG